MVKTLAVEAKAYPFLTFCRLVGISRAQGYIELNAGRLKAVKRGRSTLILAEDAQAWLDALPALQPKAA